MRINTENKFTLQAQRASLARETAENAATVPELAASNQMYDAITSEHISNQELPRLVDHLDNVSPHEAWTIRQRATLLGAFACEQAGIALPERPTIAAEESDIYIATNNEAVQKHVRTPHGDLSPAAHVDNLMLGAIRAQGESSFEQMRAASFEELAIINDFVPGSAMDTLSAKQYESASRRYGKKLIELVVNAHRLGVAGDIHPGNIMQDGKKLTLIDLEPNSRPYDPAAAIHNLSEHPTADPATVERHLTRATRRR